jgi:hypothetical protein
MAAKYAFDEFDHAMWVLQAGACHCSKCGNRRHLRDFHDLKCDTCGWPKMHWRHFEHAPKGTKVKPCTMCLESGCEEPAYADSLMGFPLFYCEAHHEKNKFAGISRFGGDTSSSSDSE